MDEVTTNPGTTEKCHAGAGLASGGFELALGEKSMQQQDGNRSIAGDELLTPAETAALYKVTIRTLEDWRRAKKGPRFVRVGNGVRYWRSDLLAYLSARE